MPLPGTTVLKIGNLLSQSGKEGWVASKLLSGVYLWHATGSLESLGPDARLCPLWSALCDSLTENDRVSLCGRNDDFLKTTRQLIDWELVGSQGVNAMRWREFADCVSRINRMSIAVERILNIAECYDVRGVDLTHAEEILLWLARLEKLQYPEDQVAVVVP